MAKIIIDIPDEDYLKIKDLRHYESSPFKFSEMFDFCDMIIDAVNFGTVVQEDNNDLANDYWKNIGYQIGINDAWEAAKKIACPPDCYEGGLYHKIEEIFGADTDTDTFLLARDVFTNFSASEAINKIKEYEKKSKKEDFNMGDEVKDNLDTVSIVICKSEEEEGYVYIMNNTYTPPLQRVPTKFLKKTGKHYDDLKDILSKLGGNSMEDIDRKIVNKIKEKLSHETT